MIKMDNSPEDVPLIVKSYMQTFYFHYSTC